MSKKALTLYWLAMAVYCGVIYLVLKDAPRYRKVDCSMSAFHPDYTPAMRQACRKKTT